jgi:hypothetical protein
MIETFLRPVRAEITMLELLKTGQKILDDPESGVAEAMSNMLLKRAMAAAPDTDGPPILSPEELTSQEVASLISDLTKSTAMAIGSVIGRRSTSLQRKLATAEAQMIEWQEQNWRDFKAGRTEERPVVKAARQGVVVVRCEYCSKILGQADTSKLLRAGLVPEAFKAPDGKRPIPLVRGNWFTWCCPNCGSQPIKSDLFILLESFQYLALPPVSKAA